jgi:hypothetical protein
MYMQIYVYACVLVLKSNVFWLNLAFPVLPNQCAAAISTSLFVIVDWKILRSCICNFHPKLLGVNRRSKDKKVFRKRLVHVGNRESFSQSIGFAWIHTRLDSTHVSNNASPGKFVRMWPWIVCWFGDCPRAFKWQGRPEISPSCGLNFCFCGPIMCFSIGISEHLGSFS